jgi:hypothetical protein
MRRKIQAQQQRRCSSSYISLAILIVGTLAACGPQGEENPINQAEVSSVRSALNDPTWYGYTNFFSRSGAKCYSRDIAATASNPSSTFYLCVVDMRLAQVRTVHGNFYKKPDGTYDTDQMYRKTVWDHWKDASFPAIAINASFFGDYAWTAPTKLSFPYKQDGSLITYGTEYGTDCSGYGHTGKVRNLYLWKDRQYAAVGMYNCSASDQAALTSWGNAPDIIGSLDPSFPIESSSWNKGRTYVAVHDSDGDHNRETLVIFSSHKASQTAAYQELAQLNVNEIIMLDGGPSSQLVVGSDLKVTSTPSSADRPVPTALIVWAW